MPQQWPSTAVDSRNFGQQINRLLDDINRPDLAAQASTYLQDSMRYYQRKPFFFSDTDNTAVLSWQANTIVTQGTAILVLGGMGFNNTIWVALNAGTTGAGPLIFPSAPTIFQVPSDGSLPPPPSGTPGTVTDNGIIWAAVASPPIVGTYAQLFTVYNVNQLVMPIDLVAFTRVEVTWQFTQRIEMQPISYGELRDYDMIRPTPPATYPTWYCWYQQQLYLWPYPAGLYPVTLSYRSAPTLANLPSDSNFWTTKAEAMIRYDAEGRMQREVIHDEQAATECFQLADMEYKVLQQQTTQQDVRHQIPPDIW